MITRNDVSTINIDMTSDVTVITKLEVLFKLKLFFPTISSVAFAEG